MQKQFLLTVAVLLVVGVILLPAFAEAQLGACFFLEVDLTDPVFDIEAVCVDGVTFEWCGDRLEGEWEEDLICDLVDFGFDGACLFDFGPPVGEQCAFLGGPNPGEAELGCLGVGGTWFDDPDLCGGQVPTMPSWGLAVLAFVMLGGALVFLTTRG
jgi:hypothetical protein